MKKILSITTIALLILMLFVPLMAESDYSLTGGDYEFNLETPLGSAPNVIGSDAYQDIEAPLTPGGLISTAAQTNDNSNTVILIIVSAIALTGICVIAYTAKKKSNI